MYVIIDVGDVALFCRLNVTTCKTLNMSRALWMDGWMDGPTDGRTDEWTDG